MDYKQKYLKYKQKYLNLKTQIAGTPKPCETTNECVPNKGKYQYIMHNCNAYIGNNKCKCEGFCDNRDDKQSDQIRFNVQTKCGVCNHTAWEHNIIINPIKLGPYNYNGKTKNNCEINDIQQIGLKPLLLYNKKIYDEDAADILAACQEEIDFINPEIGICNDKNLDPEKTYGFGDGQTIINKIKKNREMTEKSEQAIGTGTSFSQNNSLHMLFGGH
jgi:hypothetical protein